METIALDEVSTRFQSHLDIEDNYRIFFSGKYGIGKSYFLNEFFDSRKDRYNKIVISPVNYAVSSNEDIFELIKVDITLQMLLKGMIVSEEEIIPSTASTLSDMALKKPLHFLEFISSAIKKVNIGPLTIETDIVKGLIRLMKKYEVHKNELTESFKGDDRKLIDFIDAFSETTSNIFEYNFITQLINTTLENHKKVKESKDDKYENVLIIDDLDRIDPEHIFRILNILSVHNNYWGAKNKFSFDKIVVVCDIENIEEIFSHKYGPKVDFQGYIDKFYCTDIFKFSNHDALSVYVKDLNVDLKEYDKELLKFILHAFVQNKFLTIRQIIKVQSNISLTESSITTIDTSHSNNALFGNISGGIISYNTVANLLACDISFLKIVKILAMIFGSFDLFQLSLSRLMERIKVENKKTFNDLILKSLAFPWLVVNAFSQNKPEHIFFARKTDNNGTRKMLDWPDTKFVSKVYRFRLQWMMHGGEYKGMGNYFEKMEIDDMTNIYYQHSQNNNNYPKDDAVIFNLIQEVIHGLKHYKILYKAHLTNE